MERDIKPTYDELESYVENLQKQLADAQATIAALQDTIMQMGGQAAVLAKDAMAAKEQVAALQARVSELQGIADEKCRCFLERAEQSEKQLTQRTAELEAAKADKAKWEEIAGLRFAGDHKFVKEMELLKVENATLQAELERVRDQYADLSKLIKALPKVEGEITATRIPCSAAIGEWWYVGWIRFPNERTAQSYVDLLKHRQGMEG